MPKPKPNKPTEEALDILRRSSLADPIIVYPGGWGKDLPEWMPSAIMQERQVALGFREHGQPGMVGDIECAAYLWTASLSAPLRSEMAHVYFYVFTRMMAKRGVEVPQEMRRETLESDEMEMYNGLRRHLWDARLKARKQRAKEEANGKDVHRGPAISE